MMEMRDWVIVFGVLVLIGLAADAYRRIRQRNKIQLKIDRQFNNLPDVDLSGELPGGGKARVVSSKTAVKNAAAVAVDPQEPSFSDDDLLGVVGEESGRREPGLNEPQRRAATSSDAVDILLDSALQGVGEGAGDYLRAPRESQAAEMFDVNAPLAAAEERAVKAEAAYPPRSVSSQPRESAFFDAELADDDGIIGAVRIVRVADAPAAKTPDPTTADPLTQDSGAELDAAIAAAAPADGDEALTARVIGTSAEEVAVDVPSLDTRDDAAEVAEADRVTRDDQVAMGELAESIAALSKSIPETPATEQVDDPVVERTEADARAPVVDDAVTETAGPERTAEIQPAPLSAVMSVPALDLSRPVPELLASVQAQQAAATSQNQEKEQTSCAGSTVAETMPVQDEGSSAAATAPVATAQESAADPTPVPTAEAPVTASTERDDKHRHHESARLKKKKERRRHARPEVQVSFFDAHPDLAPEPEPVEPPSPPVKSGATRTRKPSKPQQEEAASAPDEVLVITVMARYEPFSGRKLFKLVEACGLTYGRMNIFHRHEQDNGAGPVQFSMVNAVHPGTFNPDTASDFTTPGVTFFLTMSEPSKLMEAFDCMLATAQCLAENLEGELRDEQRSSLRSQTVEHYRNKVRDFERRRLARRA